MRVFVAFVLLGIMAVPAAAGLSGSELKSLLAGNSIVHPDFGCVFFEPDGTMRVVNRSGEVAAGKWAVRGDLYFSSGQCGVTGCSVSGRFPSFTFRREDGGYEQPVIMIHGNYCEKDGIVS